jgi:probable rRNA maturation factor
VTVLEAEVVKAVPAGVPPAFLRKVLARASGLPEIAARLPEGGATVAIRITGDEELRELNRTYAGDDRATDVLSFAGSAQHVGDVAISWPAVRRQARQFGHDERTEVALLAVHGLLHLLGWDHVTPSERQEMTRLTVAALSASGIELAPRRL